MTQLFKAIQVSILQPWEAAPRSSVLSEVPATSVPSRAPVTALCD